MLDNSASKDIFESQDELAKFSAVNDALESMMYGYFAFGTGVGIFGQIFNGLSATTAGAKAGAGLALGWNILDGVGGIALGLQEVHAAYHAKLDRGEKAAWGALDIFLGTQLLAAQTVTTLALVGVLSVGAPAAAIGFAACMLGAFAKSIKDYKKAKRKQDPNYLVTKLMARYHAAKNKKDQFAQKCILNQIAVLYRTNKVTDSFVKNNIKDLDTTAVYDPREWDAKLDASNSNHDSVTDKKIAGYMISKQKEKASDAKAAMLEWGAATVGMSMIAAGFFCPPLIIPGLILTTVASGFKLYRLFAKKHAIVNHFEKKNAVKEAIKSVKLSDAEEDYINNNKMDTKHVKRFMAENEIIRKQLGLDKTADVSTQFSRKDRQRIIGEYAKTKHSFWDFSSKSKTKSEEKPDTSNGLEPDTKFFKY